MITKDIDYEVAVMDDEELYGNLAIIDAILDNFGKMSVTDGAYWFNKANDICREMIDRGLEIPGRGRE